MPAELGFAWPACLCLLRLCLPVPAVPGRGAAAARPCAPVRGAASASSWPAPAAQQVAGAPGLVQGAARQPCITPAHMLSTLAQGGCHHAGCAEHLRPWGHQCSDQSRQTAARARVGCVRRPGWGGGLWQCAPRRGGGIRCFPAQLHQNASAPACHADAALSASVVGLAAEVYVCRRMTQQTGGTYTGAHSCAWAPGEGWAVVPCCLPPSPAACSDNSQSR